MKKPHNRLLSISVSDNFSIVVGNSRCCINQGSTKETEQVVYIERHIYVGVYKGIYFRELTYAIGRSDCNL